MRFFRPAWSKAVLLAAVCLAAGAGVYLERASRMDLLGSTPEKAVLYEDREGRPLRFVTNSKGERFIPVLYGEIPDLVVKAFLAAEDERFFSHRGVDPWAVLRAVRDNLLAGRIVSGASTITQQVCRMACPRKRTLFHKIVEAIRALRLESVLSKKEILTLYLNRVPLGNNVLGIKAAARLYFNLDLRDLTLGQAALLASLPKSPGALNPYGPNRARLIQRWNWVLERMKTLGYASLEPDSPVNSGFPALEPRSFPFEAPHLVDLLQKSSPLDKAAAEIETVAKAVPGFCNPAFQKAWFLESSRIATLFKCSRFRGPSMARFESVLQHSQIRTTLDLSLQKAVEKIVRSHRTRLKYRGADQAAAVVLSNRGPEVLALVGSLEYGPRDKGYNNGAAALRSPGSILKPFLYAQALDQGLTAATILEDLERRFRTPDGDYRAANFDRRVYGPVSIREALGNSLNLSAVNLINRIGYQPFYEVLKSLGLINHPERSPDHYGLGLVVGNPEVSLIQIASAYACLANQGIFKPARLLKTAPKIPGRRVFSSQAGYIISHILADPGARALTFGRSRAMNPGYSLALKTGTSTNYRDCWVVGYTPGYTVAVWVGNFDGRPTWGLSGATGAAPILSEIMDRLHTIGLPGPFRRPQGIVTARVCTHSGQKPTANCPHTRTELFIQGTEPQAECSFHQESSRFHNLPAEYAGWVHSRHLSGNAGLYRLRGYDRNLDRAFGPPGPSQGRKESSIKPKNISPGRQRITITQPLEGDRFVSGGREVNIALKAVLSRPAPEVTWFIDGIQQAVTGPPFHLSWPAPRGPHRITALASGGQAASVSIVVE